MSKAALFFDIDGTILSEFTGRIPDSALRAFEEARKAGHLLFINTGRTMCSLPAEIRRLPFDGFLCGCGSYLTYRDEVLFEKHLELRRAEQIAREAKKCRIDGVFEGVEDVYFCAGVSRFSEIESMRRYMELRGLGVERYLEQGGCAFDKMYINVDALSDKERFFEFIAEDMDVIDRGKGAFECVPKGYSKGTAIEWILEKFHMSREQSYVFGDSSNDLAMFKSAGHGIAMKAHDPVLDPYAELVTKAVEDDGIAWAMEKLGLI